MRRDLLSAEVSNRVAEVLNQVLCLTEPGIEPPDCCGRTGGRRGPAGEHEEWICQERWPGSKRRREDQDVQIPETAFRGVPSMEIMARVRGARQAGASSSSGGTGSTA